jgi:hypothetical protein
MSGDARNFNNIVTRAVNEVFSLQGKAPKEIHAILTETLVEHTTSACRLRWNRILHANNTHPTHVITPTSICADPPEDW